MAEKPKPRRMQKMLECPVCFLNFNKTDRLPKALPCLHTICKNCIVSLTKGPQIQCPKCREDCVTSGVKTNYIVTDFLETLCEDCCAEEHEVKCNHCDQNVCKTCQKDHCQLFYSEFSTEVQSLAEEIDAALSASSDTSKIMTERKRAANEVEIMKTTFQKLRDMLDKKEQEMEDRIRGYRDSNIQVITTCRKNLEQQVIVSHSFMDDVQAKLGGRRPADVVDADMLGSRTKCQTMIADLQRLKKTDPNLESFKYIDPRNRAAIDVGQIELDDHTYKQPAKSDILPESYKKLKVKSVIGQKGSGAEKLDRPWEIAIAKDNSLVVSDFGNTCVKIHNSDMELQTVISDRNIHHPTGVAVNHSNQIFISDWEQHSICIYATDGTFVNRLFGNKGSGQNELSKPLGITLDSNGLLYICDGTNYRIKVVKQDGTFVRQLGHKGSTPGCFSDCPNLIYTTNEDKVLVTEWDRSEIAMFQTTGEFVKYLPDKWPADIKKPDLCGIVVDRSGNIIVCDRSNNCLHILDKSGQYVCSFGSDGSESGKFNVPISVAI